MMPKLKILLCFLLTPVFGLAQLPPPQPSAGPASSLYFHDTVEKRGPFQPPAHEGEAWYNYYIYQPASPRPANAPVVLLSPGYGAWLPDQYRAWIQHMVRMGYTVVWARSDQMLWAVWQFIPDSEAAWTDALSRMSQAGNPYDLVPPALDEAGQPVTGFTGHSLGGWVATAMAARAGRGGTDYPPPKAVIAILPGQGAMFPEDFSTIASDTKLVMMAADRDEFCAMTGSTLEKIWKATSQIPDANREMLIVQSEKRSMFDFVAGHGYPTGLWSFGGGVDQLDYHGLWKPSVGALNCAIYGEDCAYALGDGDAMQVQTGVWSDGVPAKPLLWVPDPQALRSDLACLP